MRRVWSPSGDRGWVSDDGWSVTEPSLFSFVATGPGGEGPKTGSGRQRSFLDADAAMRTVDREFPFVLPSRERRRVAALYVDPEGPYPGICEEAFDEDRHAMNFSGGMPVVAHPPCGPWGKLSWNFLFQDPSTGLHAVEMVRRHGGVLEHPVGSRLFRACGISLPGGRGRSDLDLWGGYTILVDLFDFGHRARKSTILYIVGTEDLPEIPRREGSPSMTIEFMNAFERRVTPSAFAEWLIDVAESCVGGEEWAKSVFGADHEVPPHASYDHLIRGDEDDTRIDHHELRRRYGSEKVHGRKEASLLPSYVWEDKILDLLSDGRPRTFNQICLELTEHNLTADLLRGTSAEQAILDLLSEGMLVADRQADFSLRMRLSDITDEITG